MKRRLLFAALLLGVTQCLPFDDAVEAYRCPDDRDCVLGEPTPSEQSRTLSPAHSGAPVVVAGKSWAKAPGSGVRLVDAEGRPVSGATVQFTVVAAAATGTLTGASETTTDANGVAPLPDFDAGTTAGQFELKAVAEHANAIGLPVTVVPDVPVSFEVPSTIATRVGESFSLRVGGLKDAHGNVITNASVGLTVPETGAAATFDGPGTNPYLVSLGTDGGVTVTGWPNNTVGSYSLVVRVIAGGVAIDKFIRIDQAAGAPFRVITTFPQAWNGDAAATFELPVWLTDVGGNLLNVSDVLLRADATGGTASCALAQPTRATSNGLATFTCTGNAMPGAYEIQIGLASGAGEVLAVPVMQLSVASPWMLTPTPDCDPASTVCRSPGAGSESNVALKVRDNSGSAELAGVYVGYRIIPEGVARFRAVAGHTSEILVVTDSNGDAISPPIDVVTDEAFDVEALVRNVPDANPYTVVYRFNRP